jgi:hypothetical protein
LEEDLDMQLREAQAELAVQKAIVSIHKASLAALSEELIALGIDPASALPVDEEDEDDPSVQSTQLEGFLQDCMGHTGSGSRYMAADGTFTAAGRHALASLETGLSAGQVSAIIAAAMQRCPDDDGMLSDSLSEPQHPLEESPSVSNRAQAVTIPKADPRQQTTAQV